MFNCVCGDLVYDVLSLYNLAPSCFFFLILMTSPLALDAIRSIVVPADVFIIGRIECEAEVLKFTLLDKQEVPGILLDAAWTNSFAPGVSVLLERIPEMDLPLLRRNCSGLTSSTTSAAPCRRLPARTCRS